MDHFGFELSDELGSLHVFWLLWILEKRRIGDRLPSPNDLEHLSHRTGVIGDHCWIVVILLSQALLSGAQIDNVVVRVLFVRLLAYAN